MNFSLGAPLHENVMNLIHKASILVCETVVKNNVPDFYCITSYSYVAIQ